MSGAETAEEPAEEPTEEPEAELEAGMSRDIGFDLIIQQSYLAEFLEPLNAIASECRLNIDEGGIHVALVDPANYKMANADLSPEAFESYEATRTRIGINIGRLAEAIEFADKDDLVHLTLDEETRKLHIEIQNISLDIAAIDPDAVRQEPDMPDIDYPFRATINQRDIRTAVEVAEFIDETGVMTIEYDHDDATMEFSVNGDTDDSSITISEEDDEITENESTGDASSKFSVELLEGVTAPIPKESELRVGVGVEHPIEFQYEFAEGNARVLNVLAPRVESN